MMTDWYKKSMNALALNGKAGRNQEAYSRALRMLCEFYCSKEPDDISEQELEAYFLHRRNVDRWSANTLRICYCGIRFYFVQVLRGAPRSRWRSAACKALFFRRHGPAYRTEFGEAMPTSHARVIEAIIDCRSAACGSVRYQCEECGEQHVAARCCANRHCPVCQQCKADARLMRQLERQLPTPYFMLTFTVPAPLREFLRRQGIQTVGVDPGR